MRGVRRASSLAVGALAAWLAAPRPAAAYDSKCWVAFEKEVCTAGLCEPVPGRRECDGLEAGRLPWDDDGEHARLWKRARVLAGLPVAVDQSFVVRTPTADPHTFAPSRLDRTEALRERTITIPSFAQLPDFSYALWDWASGNETCPPNDEALFDAERCHQFGRHMGWLNSNHFLPQSERHYRRLHGTALARARECRALRDRAVSRGGDPADGELSAVLNACDREAMLVEAIAQHFMQDAWSSGHMWERWGSSDFADFVGPAGPSPPWEHGGAIAVVSGLIHGAKGVTGVDDALCAPDQWVRWIPGEDLRAGGAQPGVGDLFLDKLLMSFSAQLEHLDTCAAASLSEIYAASAGSLGVATQPAMAAPSSAYCFGQRATNEAMYRAYGLNALDFGQLRLTGALVSAIHFLNFLGESAALDEDLSTRLKEDLVLKENAVAALSVADPWGTQIASGGWGTFLDMGTNSAFATKDPPYVDPAPPWLPAVAPARASRAEAGNLIARTFIDAHTADWCEAFGKDGGELDLTSLRARAGDQSLDDDTREVACQLCQQFVAPALRIGARETYDPSVAREPLCGLLAANPATVPYVYVLEPATSSPSRRELARAWCCRPDLIVKAVYDPLMPGGQYSFVEVTVTESDGAPVLGASVFISGINGSGDGFGPDAPFVTNAAGLTAIRVVTDPSQTTTTFTVRVVTADGRSATDVQTLTKTVIGPWVVTPRAAAAYGDCWAGFHFMIDVATGTPVFVDRFDAGPNGPLLATGAGFECRASATCETDAVTGSGVSMQVSNDLVTVSGPLWLDGEPYRPCPEPPRRLPYATVDTWKWKAQARLLRSPAGAITGVSAVKAEFWIPQSGPTPIEPTMSFTTFMPVP